MGRPQGWAAARAGRPAMRSPGRPPVARREHRQRFWVAIARVMPSEDAGIEAGVSPAVGTRWFRDSGGIRPVSLAPPSGRYLPFAEREEIAILRVRGCGVREIARRTGRSPSTDLAGAAPERCDPGRPAGVPGHGRPVARRSAGTPSEDRKTGCGPGSCGSMCKTGSPARSPGQVAWRCRARMCPGSDAGTVAGRIGAGPGRGARSRSRTGCGSISLMMSPCGSRTRRSTRPWMSRAAARCGVSWRHACAPLCAARPPGAHARPRQEVRDP